MSPTRGFVAFLSFATLAALGGGDTPWAAADDPLYEATGMVIQEDGGPPELCVGLMAFRAAPTCGGPRLDGWSWDAIDDEERADGRTWGKARVFGSYDGATMTVVAAGAPAPSPPDHEDIDAGCAEPPGGWSAVDPEKAWERDLDRAAGGAEEEPDFAGLWVDYYDGNRLILNVAFTGSFARHERELRKVWGGPLCVVRHDHTYEELEAIRDEVSKAIGEQALASYVEVLDGTVGIDAIVVDEATKAAVAERYGDGLVRFDEALERLE